LLVTQTCEIQFPEPEIVKFANAMLSEEIGEAIHRDLFERSMEEKKSV
jgi:hypothetical protein